MILYRVCRVSCHRAQRRQQRTGFWPQETLALLLSWMLSYSRSQPSQTIISHGGPFLTSGSQIIAEVVRVDPRAVEQADLPVGKQATQASQLR